MSITELLGIQPDALVDETGEGTDYILQDGVDSCWVEVNGIALYIRRNGDQGVSVQAYKSGDEMGEILALMDAEL